MEDLVLLSLEPHFKYSHVAGGCHRGQLGCTTPPSPENVSLASTDLWMKTLWVISKCSSPKWYVIFSHIKLKHQPAKGCTKTLLCLPSSSILNIYDIRICKMDIIIPPLPKNGKLGHGRRKCYRRLCGHARRVGVGHSELGSWAQPGVLSTQSAPLPCND